MNRHFPDAGPPRGWLRRGARALGMAVLLPVAALAAQPSEAPPPVEPPSPPDAAELEHQLEAAREKLDKAAEELAVLSKKLYVMDIEGEHSNRPMLGVLVDDKHGTDGVRIIGVTPEAGAAEAGLQAGDRLVGLNGYRLDGGEHPMHAFKEAMANVAPGDVVSVEYVRGDEVRVADVTTHARGEYLKKLGMDEDWDVDFDMSTASSPGSISLVAPADGSLVVPPFVEAGQLKAGEIVELKMVRGDLAAYFGIDEGVVVMGAPDGSELKAGDVLLAIDGEPVSSPGQVMKLLHDAKGEVAASVQRKDQQAAVSIPKGTVALEAPTFSGSGMRIMIDRREVPESSQP